MLRQKVFLEILPNFRGGSRTVVTSKMERFVTIIKRSILDVATVIDPPLNTQKNIFAGISFLIKLQAAEAATGGSL